MHGLQPDHREALTLKYINGLSSAEIGRVMGKNPACHRQLAAARARSGFGEAWLQLTSDEVKR